MTARLRRLSSAIRLVFAVQWKTGFPVIYALLAALTVAALRATPLVDYRDLLLPAIQVGEYGTLALMLVAAHRYLERNERSELALAVTPLRRGEYAAALALASAFVPTIVGTGVQVAAQGFDRDVLRQLVFLVPPLFFTSTFCGLFSIALAARHDEFTGFLMGSFVPAMLVLSLPFLAYFDVLPRAPFVWMPTDASLSGFANSVARAPAGGVLALSVGALAAWNVVAHRVAVSALGRGLAERAA